MDVVDGVNLVDAVDRQTAVGRLYATAVTAADVAHLAAALSVPDAAALMPERLADVAARVAQLLERGPSAAIWSESPRALLAAGGVAERFPHVAEAWAVIGADVTRLGLGFRFVRFARTLMDLWLEAGPWHRVDCGVPAAPGSVKRFLAWTRALGFGPEARLARACSDGHDMIVCVRFPQEESAIRNPQSVILRGPR